MARVGTGGEGMAREGAP